MAKQKNNPVDYCDIEVPVQLAIPTNRFGYRFDVKLGSDDGETLRQITQGLADDGRTLMGGMSIRSASDAITWLIQQVGRQIENVYED